MVVKSTSGGSGSSGGLVNYLEKENQGNWFSQEKENIGPLEVTTTLDGNKKNLGANDDKFYQVVISPSQKELRHIGNDNAKLREYTRGMMSEYAKNYNKNIDSKNLIWYAKIEHNRTHNYKDDAVKQKDKSIGESKTGSQTHIHVLVSRTENLKQFKLSREAGEIDRKHPLKLSPLTNHRNTREGAVQGGFDRTKFIETAEKKFDKEFNYNREMSETFKYANTMKRGDLSERVEMRASVIEFEGKKNYEEKKEKELEYTKEKGRDKGNEIER